MTLNKRLAWDHIIGAVVLLIIGVWVRWGDWADIWNIFMKNTEASHVILVLPVASYLVWVRRERFRRIKLTTSWLGPIFVAIGSTLCYFGEDQGVDVFRHLGAVTIAVGALVTMLGRDVLVSFAPAFMVLVFLIPMPPSFRDKIALPLQSVMARVTWELLTVLGIANVELSANQLTVNGHPIMIVEACNGLRLFFTLVLVCFAVAFSMPLKTYVRVLLLLASPVAAIVANVIRLVPTAWVTGAYSREVSETFHDVAGWVMLPVAFAMMYAIVWALEWALVPVGPFTLARDQEETMRVTRQKIQWLVPLVSIAVLGGMEAWKLTLPDAASGKAFLEKARNVVESFPPRVTGPDGVEWESREIELPTQAKNLLNTNSYVSREYQSPSRNWIAEVLFIEVVDSRDMVGHYPPNCYPSNGWQLQGPGDWAVWQVQNLTIPGVEYFFKRKVNGREEMKTVRDFFILPNEHFYPDLASFHRVASGFAIRNFGATQVQIIYDRDYSPEEREKIFQSLIKAHMPLIEAVSKKD